MHYSAQCGLAITYHPSVCPSVTLVDCDHVGWKSWKLIVRTISPTPLLFAVQRLLPGEHGEILRRLTLNMSFEYVEYCVFIGISVPVVRAINIGCIKNQHPISVINSICLN